MSEQPRRADPVPERAVAAEPDTATDQAAPFDKEAARARYRKLMRGPFMRLMYLLLGATLLLAWGLGIAAAFSPGVEELPGHDVTVSPRACVACHSGQVQGVVPAPPPMPHPAPPSCGFCHRQSVPKR